MGNWKISSHAPRSRCKLRKSWKGSGLVRTRVWLESGISSLAYWRLVLIPSESQLHVNTSGLPLTIRTKLRQAFQVSYKNADKLLYVLLYAFLASVDVSGEFERVEKQLETGKELTRSMGGMDREDGVGHGSLGVWFSKKLSRRSFFTTTWGRADGRDV